MGLTGVNFTVDGEDNNEIDDAVRYIEDIRQAKDLGDHQLAQLLLVAECRN